MTSTRYSYNVDLRELNSSHSLAVLAVPPGSRVLDLGAADGSVARALVRRGCRVWAVERDPDAARSAADGCERVITADLQSAEVWNALDGERFDAVLALDVLEHLTEPETVLRRATALLREDGIAVVSLPNVTHGAVRLMLLHGRFRYSEMGLLDRTHLRFFDRAGAERLVSDSGLTISERLRVTREIDATEISVDVDPDAAVRSQIASDPDATTYQFVFVARRAAVAEPPAREGGLAERLLTELEGLRARFAEVEGYARSLETVHAHTGELQNALAAAAAERESLLAEVKRQETTSRAIERQLTESAQTVERQHGEVAELRDELARRMQELQQKHLELRYSQSDLAVKQAFIDRLRADLRGLEGQVAAAAELRARTAHLELEVQALRVYSQSAGFRIAERCLSAIRRIPFLFAPARAVVRALAGRRPPGA